ncbi:RcnB family protein [Asticcacaulis sp. ZE23SCel15]|uniref:RcnB family protein n=1 Tax=Asticcacaulis sp. ZE23SCel15 TaxID=3059027 RepID=UPI00265F02E7|nr:RcnB family protein [Asticcacaulis sp. ZE23SCel15]WKL55940.1 RcnB family protein [Asticcacaulis sp. ZE23SCel15]
MKQIFAASMMAIMMASTGLSGTAMAQPRPDDRHEQVKGKTEARHDDRKDDRGDDRRGPPKGWHKHDKSSYKKGGYVAYNDWQRGKSVDYRQHKKLKAPPRGYEWRQIDNRYVLAAVATGVIATIILTR